MADIDLVIKIPEEMYYFVKTHYRIENALDMAILNGTPLPKGHGDLIDRKKLQNNIDDKDLISPKDISKIQTLRKWINNQNPIIEADKEETE